MILRIKNRKKIGKKIIKRLRTKKIKNKKIGAIISGGNIDLDDFFNKYYEMISD